MNKKRVVLVALLLLAVTIADGYKYQEREPSTTNVTAQPEKNIEITKAPERQENNTQETIPAQKEFADVVNAAGDLEVLEEVPQIEFKVTADEFKAAFNEQAQETGDQEIGIFKISPAQDGQGEFVADLDEATSLTIYVAPDDSQRIVSVVLVFQENTEEENIHHQLSHAFYALHIEQQEMEKVMAGLLDMEEEVLIEIGDTGNVKLSSYDNEIEITIERK